MRSCQVVSASGRGASPKGGKKTTPSLVATPTAVQEPKGGRRMRKQTIECSRKKAGGRTRPQKSDRPIDAAKRHASSKSHRTGCTWNVVEKKEDGRRSVQDVRDLTN